MGKTDGGPRGQGSDEHAEYAERRRPDEHAARRAQTLPPTRGGLPPVPQLPNTPNPTPPPDGVMMSAEFDDDDEVTRMMQVDPLASYHASTARSASSAAKSSVPPPGSARPPVTRGSSSGPLPAPPPPPVRSSGGPSAAPAAKNPFTQPGGTAPPAFSSTLRSSNRPPPVSSRPAAGVTPPTPFTETLRATISGHSQTGLGGGRPTMRSIPSAMTGPPPFPVEHSKPQIAPAAPNLAPAPAPTPAPASLADAPPKTPPVRPPLGHLPFASDAQALAQRKFKRLLISVVSVLAVLIVGGLVLLLRAPRGDLELKITGPTGESVNGLEVFIDGERRCSKSPCSVTDLTKGAHAVKATGKGYAPMAERQVLIDPTRKAVLELKLPPDPGTGVRVTSKVEQLRLWIDDREIGALPREVGGLAPGQHTLRVAGNPAFRPLEQKVDVQPMVLVDVRVAPEALEGTLRVEAGPDAHGAQAFLVFDGEKPQPLGRLPAEVALSAERKPTLVAKKPGFQEFRKLIEFPAGESRLTVAIDLQPEQSSAPPPAPEPPPVAAKLPAEPRPKTPAPAAPPAAPEPAATVASGTGKVNVNSIPPSSVRVNGKDLGSTPRMAVEVPAGQVTAVFTHPELGTQIRSGVVKAGGTLALSVRFKQAEAP